MNKQIEKKNNNGKLKQKFLTLALLASMSLLPLKLEGNSIHKSSNELYIFSTFRNVLVSQNPAWIKRFENVCDVQFADYINKNNEKVPVLFVAYKDGKAGFLVLPVKGENKYLHYDFEEKFEPREDGKCYIFEGVDEKENQKFLYFRVVDKNGEAVNYGIPYGMF
jgi:hypothetical protein